MTERLENCPACNSPLGPELSAGSGDVFAVPCDVCGPYDITIDAVMDLAARPELRGTGYLLSGVLRGAHEGGRRLKILSHDLDDLIASARVPRGPIEAIDRILTYLRDHQVSAASHVQLTGKEYPIVFGRDGTELIYLLDEARTLGYLERQQMECRLTLKGWSRLDELRQVMREGNQAFVAMWFSDETKAAWTEAFYPTLDDLGYEPFRIDLHEHNDRIDDRILAEIRRSGLLIADFTGGRAGVYFEAGFAMGLGIPVIWCCRADQMDKLHFDTRQYNHILWDEPSDLAEKLRLRIEATVPRSVLAP